MSSKLKDVNFPNFRILDVENPERLMDLVFECEEHLLKKIDFVHQKFPFALFLNYFSRNKNFLKKCCYLFKKIMIESWS